MAAAPEAAILLALCSADLVVAAVEFGHLDVARVVVIFDLSDLRPSEDLRMKVQIADSLASGVWDTHVVWIPVNEQSRQALETYVSQIALSDFNWPIFAPGPAGEIRQAGQFLPPVVGYLALTEGFLHDEEIALCRSLEAQDETFRQRWLIRSHLKSELMQELPATVATFEESQISLSRFLWSIDFLPVYPQADLSSQHLGAMALAASHGVACLIAPEWAASCGNMAIACDRENAPEMINRLWFDHEARRNLIEQGHSQAAQSGHLVTEPSAWFSGMLGPLKIDEAGPDG